MQHHGLHSLAHVDEDVGAAGEAVARRVEVELQRVARGNHGLRQVAGGGVEIEARLWRCLLLAWSSQAYRHGERLHEIAWHERIR